MKRLALVLVVAVAFLAWFFWPRPDAAQVAAVSSSHAVSSSPPAAPIENRASKIESSAVEHSPIAEKLNAPDGTIRRDLELLNEVLGAWQTNFPHEGNPIGENAEITAALAGKNPLHFAFIAPNHPAINARGELCDRWGTPFFFHAQSGTRMEIRSAGPDRKLYTSDDIVLTP
jgi:hypothetical protein